MSHHGCCNCANEPTCNCLGDCNDLGAEGSQSAANCWGCCWSLGDAIRLKANWAGSGQQFRRETQYAAGGSGRCADVSYSGGEIEVEYLVVGCSTTCPTGFAGRTKVLFALNTRFGDVEWSAADQSYVVQNSAWRYKVRTQLALVCESEEDAGDHAWRWFNDCNSPELLPVCVQPCRDGCVDVAYSQCNGGTNSSYCSGGSAIAVHGPDYYQCEHCVDAVVDCGGLKAYCVYRWVDSECAYNGNAYGQLATDPVSCGNDCEDNMSGSYHPVETCLTAFAQTLRLEPPVGSSRACLWHEWTAGGVDYQCCRSAAKVPGGTDIDVPTTPTTPTVGSHSWPSTGWTYSGAGDPCDCFQSPQTVTSCVPTQCPAVTTAVTDFEVPVCL